MRASTDRTLLFWTWIASCARGSSVGRSLTHTLTADRTMAGQPWLPAEARTNTGVCDWVRLPGCAKLRFNSTRWCMYVMLSIGQHALKGCRRIRSARCSCLPEVTSQPVHASGSQRCYRTFKTLVIHLPWPAAAPLPAMPCSAIAADLF